MKKIILILSIICSSLSVTAMAADIDLEALAAAAAIISADNKSTKNSAEISKIKESLTKINNELNLIRNKVLPINEDALFELREYLKSNNLDFEVWMSDKVLASSAKARTAINEVIQSCFNTVLSKVEKKRLNFPQLYFVTTQDDAKFSLSRAYDMPRKKYMSNTLYLYMNENGEVPAADQCVRTILGQGLKN